jgi:hypothetical protein
MKEAQVNQVKDVLEISDIIFPKLEQPEDPVVY